MSEPPRHIEVNYPLIKGIAGGAFILVGLAILAWQSYTFLHDGNWPPVSLIDAAICFSQSPWLFYPQEWIGAHKILDNIPASAALIAVGYFIAVAE